jgi:DNA-directed RNA polymerase specialized sigma subunit
MSPQAGFVLKDEIVPRLVSAIPHSVLCVGSEDHKELIQDGITMAARMLDRVESQGKLGQISASNIAYYTILHLKTGRRANGSSCVDVLGSSTQLNGTTRLKSLQEVVSESETGDEIFELQDVISNNNEDPAIKATRKLDWDSLLSSLSKMERLVVQCLSSGRTLREAGRSVGLSDSSMQTYRRKLALKIIEFMGGDILKDIAVQPNWKIGLNCEQELLACRADRRH